MSSRSDANRIDASPTKDFFIFMLTKDITDIDAVADLVDNCIDGARRLKPLGDYSDLFVNIETEDKYFSIEDNCGGIPIDLARNYAFRFGRAKGMEKTPHSIGQFGVGMKRALFKIGKFFRIESISKDSRFIVEQDIEEWAKDENSWEFQFKSRDEDLDNINELETGTKIRVEKLNQGISKNFPLENFRKRLQLRLQAAHQESIDKGLQISLNGIYLESSPPTLLKSKNLVPAYEEIEREDGKVKVRIFTGLSDRDPRKAGWNIYCNGRLIVESDKSSITGWGREFLNPEYHNDYSRFRGYVYFDSDEAELLPWNTTKSSVDTNSELYDSVRLEMVKQMSPVIDFLGEIAKERSNDGTSDLEEKVSSSKSYSIKTITKESIFVSPEAIVGRLKMSKISYSKPSKQVEKVKKILKAKTLPEVGQKTFDYYVSLELEE